MSVENRVRKFAAELRGKALKAGGYLKMGRQDFGRWRFLLSYGSKEEMIELATSGALGRRVPYADAQHFTGRWHLSAELRTNFSEESDWKELGMVLAAVGAPLDSCLTPVDKADPASVLHWDWAGEP